jgi:hypothetical protein
MNVVERKRNKDTPKAEKKKSKAKEEFTKGKTEVSADEAKKAEDKKQQEKQIDILVQAAETSGRLFHDASDVAYVDLTHKNHRETWPINSRQFKSWLMHQYWLKNKSAPSSEALTSALRLIESMACFEGEQREVFLRVAPAPGGGIYLDLCNADWQVIWIGPDSWSISAATNRCAR